MLLITQPDSSTEVRSGEDTFCGYLLGLEAGVIRQYACTALLR